MTAGFVERRRIPASPDEALLRRRALPAIYIIDANLRLIASHISAEHARERRRNLVLVPQKGILPPAIASTVRRLVGKRRKQRSISGVARTGLVVRIAALDNYSGDETMAVFVETQQGRDHLARAAKKFAFTKRESEVLALLIDGARSKDIAQKLAIGEATAIFHVKGLLEKTGSRTRLELISKVVG